MAAVASRPLKGDGELLIFDNEEDVAVSLAKYMAELSDKYSQEKGQFKVALSTGSLIIKTLGKLAESPYDESVDWASWHVSWVDERFTRFSQRDDEVSNYVLAYFEFLSKVPLSQSHVRTIDDRLSVEDAADDYELSLKTIDWTKTEEVSFLDEVPKFDLMLLEMGADGHVASLFPGHPILNESQRWVTFIKDSPESPPERVTLTFPVINTSANIALLVTGADKADAVSKALGDEQSSDLLPVQMVSPESGKLTWFADKGAVSKTPDISSL